MRVDTPEKSPQKAASSGEKRKEKQQIFDDEMNDILNMNPVGRGSKSNVRLSFGVLPGEESQETPAESDKKEVKITKEPRAIDDFYKFMDNIEEET